MITERISLSQDGQSFTSTISYELLGAKEDTVETGKAKSVPYDSESEDFN